MVSLVHMQTDYGVQTEYKQVNYHQSGKQKYASGKPGTAGLLAAGQ